MSKAEKETIRWPATGRLLEVAAVDVERFEADGWERVDVDASQPSAPAGGEVDDEGDVLERPPGNGSRGTWAEFVAALGGDPGELSRDELIEEADRLISDGDRLMSDGED